MFGQASIEETRVIKLVLSNYYLTSGQSFNVEKLNIFFMNVNPLVKSQLLKFWGFQSGTLPCKYLGIPFFSGKEKHVFWDDLISSTSNQILLWKSKWLSFAGKLVMLKVVLHSLPSYLMSVLKIPYEKGLTLQKLFKNFLWEKNVSI